MSPSTLTAGPRGRRVLLELATMIDDGAASAAHSLSFALDPERGTGRNVLFAWGTKGSQRELNDRFAAQAPTAAEFARMLARLELPEQGPSETMLNAALTESVGDAMYWQAPHGEDVLTSREELRAPLRRLAAWAAPAVPEWWSGPMDPGQYAIGWRGDRPGGDASAWKERTLEEERSAREDRPSDPGAPWSGTWWSFPDGIATTRAHKGVPTGLDWTEDMSAGAEEAEVYPVDTSGARILEIEDTGGWVTLCWDQPLEVTASRRHDWYRVTGGNGRWVVPDWAELARKYDAVHLTARAYLAGATRALTVDTGIFTMIAGWGPDETHWLNPPPIGDPEPWGLLDEAPTERLWRKRA